MAAFNPNTRNQRHNFESVGSQRNFVWFPP
jgi:hypothetical protein